MFIVQKRVSDNWWNTENCLKPNGVNKTREFFGTDTIKLMLNTSSMFNKNFEPWNRMELNKLQDKYFKNDSQLIAFCSTLKSLSTGSPKNFTEIRGNGSDIFSSSGEKADFLNQLRNCFGLNTVTPAEEYWECVKFILDTFCFARFSWVGILL